MVKHARFLFSLVAFLGFAKVALAADARFDLVGPRIDVRVTRGNDMLPIAEVPNLQPGDKIWLHPDLPPSQSVHYLLICVFLRGSTNPPPDDWFIRIPTWDKKVRQEGAFVVVPDEAQQAVLFMAPETGGDFSTLKSAVRGRPGIFVRASQDLNEAGFEQARIEKYLASIRLVPPSDPAELQKHSDLLARTLALKPNADCFKRSPDMQFTCLTQTGSQTLLDDGHGQSIASRLSSGPSSDFIAAASYTSLGGGGIYSAYVGAVVDLVRLMTNLHTAQYQYIPAIAFPQAQALNLRLNTPPSFHSPKSVLVIGLPAVQVAQSPPLRPADADRVTCLLQPQVVLPIEGAPLVFSTSFAHELVLHLNTPPGAAAKPDVTLKPDAFQGGLVLQQDSVARTPLRPGLSASRQDGDTPGDAAAAAVATTAKATEPVMLTGTIRGRWGFDAFTGPTVTLQQLPGEDWHIVSASGDGDRPDLIAGHSAQLFLASTGTACVHTMTAAPPGSDTRLQLSFKPAPRPEAKADHPALLAVTLPLDLAMKPGDLHLAIQQFGQPKPDQLATRTFSEPTHVNSVELRAHDKAMLLTGSHLDQIEKVSVGDLEFRPDASGVVKDTLRLSMSPVIPAPPTKADERLTAQIVLRDGRSIPAALVVSAPRPVVSLLRKSAEPEAETPIAMANADDVPLASHLTFTLKSPQNFPRNGRIEVETLDGTLRATLTLAPSGGLMLQDPHTVVAMLDPLRSFGPSAFGPIHLRAIFPAADAADARPDSAAPSTSASPSSDWLPLATLVRLPTLAHLQCPADIAQPCTLTGGNLFLIDSLSVDPAFANPVPVPDGYTGTTLSVPHPAASTIFLHLRDDPAATASAVVPAAAPSQASGAGSSRVRAAATKTGAQ